MGFFSDFDDDENDWEETTPTSAQEEEEYAVDSDERRRRKLLKKHLQQRNKLRKYETRMQQGIFRKDKALEESARRDWEAYTQLLKDDPNSCFNYTIDDSSSTNSGLASKCFQLNQAPQYRYVHQSLQSMESNDTTTNSTEADSASMLLARTSHKQNGRNKMLASHEATPRVTEASSWILQIRQQLVPLVLKAYHQRTNQQKERRSTSSRSLKEEQNKRAAQLKANMQQGTQTESMFADDLALLGYTRQKFHERAVLQMTSLDRLDPIYGCDDKESNTANANECDSDKAMLLCVWGRLLATQQVVSIGCGPGCDAVGVLGFFQSHGIQLEHGILLMDFVMDAWKNLVLDSLTPLLSPKHVSSIQTVQCDIRAALKSNPTNENVNSDAWKVLSNDSSSRRLVVISYLLTETRFRWKDFFRDFLELLEGTQSLLLLTEPTAWQLHEFLRCFGGKQQQEEEPFVTAHTWLDSSRDLPHLQDVDNRNGPATLLVCLR